MKILAVDTAGKTAGVAVMEDDRLLYEVYLDAGLTHSETLLPMVDAALKACRLSCADIDLYGVNAGPGSFTGLRIGLAAVKGLALPRQTPCAPVSTLEALAAAHIGEGTVVCALDARRGQVYSAAFDLDAVKGDMDGLKRLILEFVVGQWINNEEFRNCIIFWCVHCNYALKSRYAKIFPLCLSLYVYQGNLVKLG